MAATRKIRNITLQFDDAGKSVESLEIRTVVEMTDPDNPDRKFVSGEAVHELLADLTKTQRDAIAAVVNAVADEVLERKSPLVTSESVGA